MGTPVNCPDAGIVLNGGFDTEEFWLTDIFWSIANGTAQTEGDGIITSTFLRQFTNLDFGETYVLDFDVLELEVQGTTGLVCGLGAIHGPSFGPIRSIGHKRAILLYSGEGEWIRFYMIREVPFAWFCKIDNVVMSKLECFIACALGFANLPGTKFEYYDLGDNVFHVFYADHSGITKLQTKIDLKVF